MKKPGLILLTLITIVIVLFGARTVVSNRLSTSGVALGSAQEEISTYRTDNAILKEKIFSLSSLSYVSALALKRGFVESKTTFALTKAQPIALKQ